MRCFLEKFTQLAQTLHDCRSRRSWRISTLTRSCFMSFYLRSDLGDQFCVHVRWRLGLWWWQSTTDSPHSVSSGAEKKNNCTVCRFLSCWLPCLYNPSHSLGTEEVPGNMGMLDQVNFVSFCNNFLIVTKLGCCVTLGSGEHCIFWRRSSQGDLHQEPPHCPVEKNQLC